RGSRLACCRGDRRARSKADQGNTPPEERACGMPSVQEDYLGRMDDPVPWRNVVVADQDGGRTASPRRHGSSWGIGIPGRGYTVPNPPALGAAEVRQGVRTQKIPWCLTTGEH